MSRIGKSVGRENRLVVVQARFMGRLGEKWVVAVNGYRLSFRSDDVLKLIVVMVAKCSEIDDGNDC